MAIILPHGVLFRGGVEARIRTKLLDDGHIDTVIGLPANLFYSTGIPICILVLKKCKKPDDVLFINASEHFLRGKRQNQLTQAHIDKIVSTYQNRAVEEGYSERVTLEEIAKKNDYNLNISRYVSNGRKEVEIDLAATHAELLEIENKIRTLQTYRMTRRNWYRSRRSYLPQTATTTSAVFPLLLRRPLSPPEGPRPHHR